MDTAVIELTTVYTLPEDRHVVIQRSFLQGTSRSVPNIGSYRWAVNSVIGGYDACRYYTDAVIACSETPDLPMLQELVDHVVDQTAIDTTVEDTDNAAERKKACAGV